MIVLLRGRVKHARAHRRLRRALWSRTTQRFLISDTDVSKYIPAEVQEISARFAREGARFDAWRRMSFFRTLGVGIAFGACGLGFAVYWSVDRRTLAAEWLFATMARASFRRARSYQERKDIMMGMPERVIPFDTLEAEAIARIRDVSEGSDRNPIVAWATSVTEAFEAIAWSNFMVCRSELRRALVEELRQSDLSLAERTSELRALLPHSVERDIAIFECLTPFDWFDPDVLEANKPHSSSESCDAEVILLTKALSFFPQSFNQLVLYLRGHVRVEDVLAISGLSEDEATMFESCLREVRRRFNAVGPKVQDYILLSALTQAIALVTRLGQAPYRLYVGAVEADLLGPLRREARISEYVLQQVKCVYLALPPHIQARVLLTAIEHPSARGSVDDHGQAAMVRDLFAAGGVVAVKLAQMLAEDTRVPSEYRNIFGSLRDDNEPMGASAFWHAIPSPLRVHITQLGPCLGTGSVKQVHRAKFDDGGEYAVAVLRRGVEDEALASLSALEASPHLELVANRLKHLVYGEFNLFAEGEALSEFATTPIGTHKRFRVMGVKHNSPRCLVEEIAPGPTVATVLKGVTPGVSIGKELASTLDTLVEFHKVVIDAFMNSGLVHSDIHLGNMIQEDVDRFALFDVGQFMRISSAETKALLWAMCWMSTPWRHVTLDKVAVKHLVSVSSIRGAGTVPLPERIRCAFREAVAPFEDGTLPEPKTSWMLFLRNAERMGVILPQGAFALAKMMDSMWSQQLAFDLSPVLEEACSSFLLKQMTWREGLIIGWAALVHWTTPRAA